MVPMALGVFSDEHMIPEDPTDAYSSTRGRPDFLLFLLVFELIQADASTSVYMYT